DSEQRVNLVFCRPLVDDAPPGAVALVNCTRPAIRASHAETVQPDIAEVPFGDLHGHDALAWKTRRRCVELAGTAVVAATRSDHLGSDHPVNVSHRYPPGRTRKLKYTTPAQG